MLLGAGRHQLSGSRFRARANLGAPTSQRGGGFSIGKSANLEQAWGPGIGIPGSQGGAVPPNTTIRSFAKPTAVGLNIGLISNEPHQIITLAREIYDNDGLLGAVVDTLATISVGAFSLSGVPREILHPYEMSLDRVRCKTLMQPLTRSHLVDGAFLGSGLFDEDQKVWDAIVPQDLLHSTVTPVPFFGATPIIDIQMQQDVLRSLRSGDERMRRYIKYLPEDMLHGGVIKLQPENTFYVPRRGRAEQSLGVSIYRKVMIVYLLEKALARGTIEMAYRRQRAMTHISVGDENWDPSIADMKELADLFMCLSGTSMIWKDGEQVRLDSICSREGLHKDEGVDVDFVTRGIGQNVRVTKWWYRGETEVMRVTTKRGRTLDATSQHLVMVLDLNTFIPHWVCVKDLGTRDLLYLDRDGDDLWFDQVQSIELLSDKQHVYDLTIEDGEPPAFLANDIIVHNSADLDPLGAFVVTRQGVQPSEMGGMSGDMFRWTDVYDVLASMKLKGMAMPDGLLGGDMALDSVSATLTVFINMTRQLREEITRLFFYEKFFPYLAVTNGHRKDHFKDFKETGGARFQSRASDLEVDMENFITPMIQWHQSMRPEGDAEYLNMLMTASQQFQVPVPIRIATAAVGFDVDDLINGSRDDLALRKKLAEYQAEIQGITQAAGLPDPNNPMGGMGGPGDMSGGVGGPMDMNNPNGAQDGGQGFEEGSDVHELLSPIKKRGVFGRTYDERLNTRTSINGHSYHTTARERARLDERNNRIIARAAAEAARRENARERAMQRASANRRHAR